MSSSPRTIAVAGVTGKLGRLITYHLLSQNIKVHGIGRNPSKLPEEIKNHSNFKAFTSDFKDVESLRPAVKGCSTVICVLLSSPDVELASQKTLIDACIAENVPRFMPNDFTVDWRHCNLDLMPQKRVNEKLLAYLEERQDKIKHAHVLNGGFMETLSTAGFWFSPKDGPVAGMHYWGTGDEKWDITSYDHAARFAVAVALDDDATGYLKVRGDLVSAKDVAKIMQKVYGLSEIPMKGQGSLDELEAQVRKGLEEDPQSSDFWTWMGKSYTLFLSNGQGSLGEDVNDKKFASAVQIETLERWLQKRKIEDLSKAAMF